MLAIANLAGLRLFRLEFGAPREPIRSVEEHLRWVLADYPHRREAQWDVDVDQGKICLLKLYFEERQKPHSDLLTPIVKAFGFYASAAAFARHETHPMLSDPDLERRIAATLATGSFAEFDSARPLFANLYDPDPAVRSATIIALSKLAEPAEFDRLEAAAHGNPELEAAVAAGRARRESLERGEGNTPFVRITLRDPNFYEDLCAMAALLWVDLVKVLLDGEASALERWRAAHVLRVAHVPSRTVANSALAIACRDNEELELRIECVRLLGSARFVPAVAGLCRLLTTPEPALQDVVIDALGEIGQATAVGHLLNHYEDRAGQVRERIERAVFRLARTLSDDDYAAWSRGQLEFDPHSAYFFHDELWIEFPREEMQRLLSDPNALVRRDAAFAFGLWGDQRDVKALEALLQRDPDASTREVASRAASLASVRPAP